jgi:eukaryotic-like serine/threonine-protein kinase
MAIEIPDFDRDLASFARHEIGSLTDPNVRFRMGSKLGDGSMGVAYFGMRRSPAGKSPVVIKLLRPEYVLDAGDTAALVFQKEAVALSRLNDRVPPTPFVVRLIDIGRTRVRHRAREFDLPWLALEYVHGGAEGTTLTERVIHSAEKTGSVFDPDRAARAIDCIAKGLEAVHDVGVIHRDLTPNNVLCCGFGAEEIFKITDFGLARPVGVAGTFGGMAIGTIGFAPPEQAALDVRQIGTWSDVFSFAAVVYFVLTGKAYFPSDSLGESLNAMRARERPSLLDSPLLSPELRARQAACHGIDQALAQATAARPEERPQTAALFAATLLPWLKTDSRPRATTARRLGGVTISVPSERVPGIEWTVRQVPSSERVVRSVAWDGDGRCLCATSDGLTFWNGIQWLEAPAARFPAGCGVRFVHRMGAGSWLVGGDGALLATYDAEGTGEVVQGPNPTQSFLLASGDFDDLAVVVGASEGFSPVLYALSSGRWLKPLPLEKAAAITSLARIDDERWLVTGRRSDAAGFAAIYQPLMWDAVMLPVPRVRALLASAGRTDRRLGLVAGAEGLVAWVEEGTVEQTTLEGEPDLSAAAIDVGGRHWVAGAGSIWLKTADRSWMRAWRGEQWNTPIISLFADVGMVIGVSVDGGVVEGRFREG